MQADYTDSSIGQTSWNWNGSALDSTGGNMNTVYDGTTWYTGVDIAGIARLDSMSSGKLAQWQQGRGITSSGALQGRNGKCAAMTSNGTTAWALTGVDPGGGAIQKRTIASGGIWNIVSTNYYGDVSGPIANGRPTGHRRIYEDTTKNAVYICCQRSSDGNGGIAYSVGGGTFADFDASNGFSIGRMYRAIVGSAVGFSDTIYACADNATGDTASKGNAPAVVLYTKASTGSPSYLRLDNLGTNNPGGLSGAQSMLCMNESGKDALYIVAGESDTINGGLWRCTITGDPTTGSWQSSPQVAWVKLNGGVLAASHQYRSLTGQRVGNATYIMVGNNPAGGGTAPSLSGSIPNAGSNYNASLYRALDAHTNTPTWEAITNTSNISPGGTYNPTFGTANETWVQLTGAQAVNSNKCVLGGSSWNTYDMDIDPLHGVIVAAGKSGSWITQNPWVGNAANVTWQQFSNSTGGVINTAICIHPSGNLKWTMTDVDRAGYYNLDGGAGQMHGIESAFGTTCHANFIVQAGSNPGRWLLGDDAHIIHASDNWYSTINPNTAPTFTSDAVSTATGALDAVAEITYGGSTYRIAVDDGQNALHLKINNGSWSNKYSFGAGGHQATIIANDGYKDFWVMVPTAGLFYFPDITNVTSGNTSALFASSASGSDADNCGRVAQDASNRTTLYVTWGSSLKGLWKLTTANDLTVNGFGTKITGTGTITRMTSGSLLGASTSCGSVSVDVTNNDLVVAIPGYSGTPDVLLFDGTNWSSIADTIYREVGMLPTSIIKKGNRIYTSQSSAGVPFAVLS